MKRKSLECLSISSCSISTDHLSRLALSMQKQQTGQRKPCHRFAILMCILEQHTSLATLLTSTAVSSCQPLQRRWAEVQVKDHCPSQGSGGTGMFLAQGLAQVCCMSNVPSCGFLEFANTLLNKMSSPVSRSPKDASTGIRTSMLSNSAPTCTYPCPLYREETRIE